MIRLPKSRNCPNRLRNTALAGDSLASRSRRLGRRSNHVKINASNSGVPFLPELKDFENAYDAFLLDSSPMVKNFGDLNVSNIKSFGSEVWNSFLAPFDVYNGHWVLNILTILFIALLSYTLLILTPRQ